jgi:hypothetical protein
LKNPSQKKYRAGGVAQDEGPEFKHQYSKKKMYFAINGGQKFSSDAFLGYRVSTASNVF